MIDINGTAIRERLRARMYCFLHCHERSALWISRASKSTLPVGFDTHANLLPPSCHKYRASAGLTAEGFALDRHFFVLQGPPFAL
jgi:hypothetical protein